MRVRPHRSVLALVALSTLTPACYSQAVLEKDELLQIRRAAPLPDGVVMGKREARVPTIAPGSYIQFQRKDGSCTDALSVDELYFNDLGVFYDNPKIKHENVTKVYVEGLTPEDHARLSANTPPGCTIDVGAHADEFVLECPGRLQDWITHEVVVTPSEEVASRAGGTASSEPERRRVVDSYSGTWTFEVEGITMHPRPGTQLGLHWSSERDRLYESLAWEDVERSRVFTFDELHTMAGVLVPPFGLAGAAVGRFGAPASALPSEGLEWSCEQPGRESASLAPSVLRLQKGQVNLSDEGSTTFFEADATQRYLANFFFTLEAGVDPVFQNMAGGTVSAGVRTHNLLEFELGAGHMLTGGLGEPATQYTNLLARAGFNLDVDPDRRFSVYAGWEGGLGASPTVKARVGARWSVTDELVVGLYPFNPMLVSRLDADGAPIDDSERWLFVSSVGVTWRL